MQFAYAFVVLWLFGFGTETSSAQACAPSAPSIAISPDFHGYELDHGKSREELALALKKPIPFKGFAMQGLTALDFGTAYKMSVTLSDNGHGVWCARVDSVEGKFGTEVPAHVMVAREIEQDTCEYRTVLDHERGHVEIGRRATESGAREMQAAIAEALTKPITAGSRDGAYAAAKALVDRAAAAGAGLAIAKADAENAAMDTYESYERLRKQCP